MLLPLYPFQLRFDGKGWWFKYFLWYLWVWLSVEGDKNVAWPGYLRSKYGVVWLWHLLLSLYPTLPIHVIVTLLHPQSDDSQDQETFLASSSDK